MKNHYDNQKIIRINYLIKNNNLDLANKEIEEYKLLYPYDLIVYKYSALILLKKGLFNDAEKLCLDILDNNFHVDNLKGEMYHVLGDAYKCQGKIEDAIKAYELSINTKINNTTVIQCKLSELYVQKNEFDKAQMVLKPLASNSSNSQLIVSSGVLYYKQKDYDKALSVLLSVDDSLLKGNKDIQYKNMHIGNIYLNFNDYEKALEYYKKALLTKNYYYWYSYFNIGVINYKLGYNNEAINILEKAINKIESDDIVSILIRAYLKKGYITKASSIIDEIKNPNTKQLYLGRIALSKENYEEAEKILEELINNNNYNNNDYLKYVKYYLVVSKFRLKKYDEVLKMIDDIQDELYSSRKYNRDYKYMSFYAMKKLGNNIESIKYMESQLVSYSKEKAISHILSHHMFLTKTSSFYSDVDINTLFDYIYNVIDNDKKIIYGPLDKYTITLREYIGNDSIRDLNSISVICITDTKNIITMYPDKDEEKSLEEIDETIHEKKAVKRLSQIEKFNKKYNKNK